MVPPTPDDRDKAGDEAAYQDKAEDPAQASRRFFHLFLY